MAYYISTYYRVFTAYATRWETKRDLKTLCTTSPEHGARLTLELGQTGQTAYPVGACCGTERVKWRPVINFGWARYALSWGMVLGGDVPLPSWGPRGYIPGKFLEFSQ